jgi:predicted MFS family arabinose efflux permease
LQINATQMAPERRGAAVSAFACCFYMGQSLGVSLAGMVVGHFGTRIVIAVGAIGVLIAALNFSQLRKKKQAEKAT